MSDPAYTCVLVSDFNLQNLAGYIANDPEFPRLETQLAPFGQVVPTLMGESGDFWQDTPDAALVWTRPQSVIPAFNDLLGFKPASADAVIKQVDEFAALLKRAASRTGRLFVPTWVLPSYQRVFGLLEMKSESGLTSTLMRMNLHLIESLDTISNIHVFDTHRWTQRAGTGAHNPKLWYLGKIAFDNECFKLAARELKAALRGTLGLARKLIIVDLDDTLWGGIVGDLGWENLVLGGHHHLGEAYVDFQLALKSMTRRGIVLAVVSKNEEQAALEAIRKHPEMALGPEDFAAWRINWGDKAQNIVDLLAELNLGPQSAVFIDDNPAERARVRDSLPEVLVPDWPEDPMLYPSALLSLDCFEIPSLSREDLERTSMYLSESRRRELKRSVSSAEQWLSQLAIRVRIEALKPANLQRAAQLLNKTNQMNLSTRRMSEKELMAWAGVDGNTLWTLRVSDRFGDSGLTGIVSLQIKGKNAQLVDFILSCRVMGRKIEEAMLAAAIDHAAGLGIDDLSAVYIPTPKNRPCLEFFQNLAPRFVQKGQAFVRDAQIPFSFPEHIEIIR